LRPNDRDFSPLLNLIDTMNSLSNLSQNLSDPNDEQQLKLIAAQILNFKQDSCEGLSKDLLAAFLFMFLTDTRKKGSSLDEFNEYLWTRLSSEQLLNRMLQSEQLWVREAADRWHAIPTQTSSAIFSSVMQAIDDALHTHSEEKC
jgi:hypothetical protein